MKLLHPLSRRELIACVKHAKASRVLHFALYANCYGSVGRDVIETTSFNTTDSRTLRGTKLHAIGRIFGQAAVDIFLGRGVILVVRQESGSTSVLMDSWNRSVKIADSSLAAYLRVRLGRPSWPEDDFSRRD